MTFEDALFVKNCKAVAKDHRITLDQVADVLFGIVKADVEPDQRDACRVYIRQEYAHSFCWQLTQEGLIVQRMDS